MEVKKVGVVGCGAMGSGIAQVCAQSGYQVIASEINKGLLHKGLVSINNLLTKNVDKGKISQQKKDATLANIKGTTDLNDFNDRDLIIEAATENMSLKKELFAELDKICPEHTILATNTSCLAVVDMAMATSKPEKVLGLHFMNPVPLMKLLEIVKTIATSDETLETGKFFGESLGKTVIIVKDTPGFIVNRLSIPLIINAIQLLEAGVASGEDIDTAVTLGLNHPVGPLALSDLIGNDVVLSIARNVYEALHDPRFAPPLLLKSMVTAGLLGQKVGKGFHEYK
ncbi:3-hydroxyacyl-CoA dehydrogenase family protein [Chloroflexota bacterium]